jgi:paraquat-inducible protein B
MGEPPHRAELPDIPEAVAAPRSARSIQLVWLIPLIAVLVGGWIAVKTILERGPTITISFKTGEGLEAGKTKIKYKDIEIGLITSVALAPDRNRVVATANLDRDAEPFLVEDTRFWAVRPQVTASGVSGLSTLLSGPFIAVDPGRSKEKRHDFVALDVPPIVTREEPGRAFVLRAADLGSHDVGVPVFFRRLPVGEVVERELDKDGKGVSIKLFVRAPYDQYVTTNTRFWSASGIDVSVGATGVEIQTESMVSILIGGIAFQTRPDAEIAPAADAKQVFQLYRTRAEAMRRPDLDVVHLVFVFKESVRGLSVGAPVEFRGIAVGEVVRIGLEFHPRTFTMVQPVEVQFYPGRMRAHTGDLATMLPLPQTAEGWAKRVQLFVEHGMRGQLRTGNLLTGQKYIAIDLFPGAPKMEVSFSKQPFEIPVMPGALEDIEAAVASILKKLEKVQYEQIGADVRKTMATLDEVLKSTDRLVQRLDAELVGETRSTLQAARAAIERADRGILAPDASLQEDVREALREIARAADALRALASLLESQPESLIRGKQPEQ